MRTALLVLLAYAVLGAVAGVVWEWVWTPPGQVIAQHQVFYDSYSSLRRVFTGTGLYVLVGAVASALLALAVCILVAGPRAASCWPWSSSAPRSRPRLMWRVGTLLGPADPATLAAHTTGRHTRAGRADRAGEEPLPGLAVRVVAGPLGGVLRVARTIGRRPSSRRRCPAGRSSRSRHLAGSPPVGSSPRRTARVSHGGDRRCPSSNHRPARPSTSSTPLAARSRPRRTRRPGRPRSAGAVVPGGSAVGSSPSWEPARVPGQP